VVERNEVAEAIAARARSRRLARGTGVCGPLGVARFFLPRFFRLAGALYST